MIEVDGLTFRDLDHDGELAPYEDWRNPVEVRVEDLVGRMTIAEKVGQLLHGSLPSHGPLGVMGVGSEYDLDAFRALVENAAISSMISRLSPPPAELAAANNAIQAIAAETRLGIPVTISTDPRHHFSVVTGASTDANGFSQWPGSLGLAATGDPELVKTFGDVVRRDYRAVGIHMALSPQADLATEPRWPRADGTFGADPALVRAMVGAYVRGLQGESGDLDSSSVAAVVKHWVGYGASRDGFDGHNHYGRFSAFPGGRFDDHVEGFLDAFEAGVAGVMPTYNILEGLDIDGVAIEEVGAGFSEQLLNGLLRGTHNFDGLVLSDWGITRDITESGMTGEPPQQPADIGMCWGVEDLTRTERFAKGLNAGIDQFGGEDDPGPFFEALDAGMITEAAIDQAVARVLKLKFDLGLFDNPFVDPDSATNEVGSDEAHSEAAAARRRSAVLLKTDGVAAIKPDDVVYLYGMEPDALTAAGIAVTDDLDAATAALVRLATPSELLHPGFFFGQRQPEGDIDFKEGDAGLEALRTISAKVPSVVVVTMIRPAVLTNIVDHARVLIAEFGTDDVDLLENLTDASPTTGRLPFELPASMADVLAGNCDDPAGSAEPLYPRGYRHDG